MAYIHELFNVCIHEVDAELNVFFASQHFEMLCDSNHNPLFHPITNMTFVKEAQRQRSELIIHPVSSILHKFILLPALGSPDLERSNTQMAYELEDTTPRYL
jgi:hypothetical protein